MTKISNEQNIEASEPHWIEWATGMVSALIVVALIAWIGKDAILDRDTSPNLTGAVVDTEKRSDGFQVRFEVRNGSSATASKVNVLGEISDGVSVLEHVQTILDYVPGHSSAKGGLVFQQDPSGKTVTIRANAFTDP